MNKSGSMLFAAVLIILGVGGDLSAGDSFDRSDRYVARHRRVFARTDLFDLGSGAGQLRTLLEDRRPAFRSRGVSSARAGSSFSETRRLAEEDFRSGSRFQRTRAVSFHRFDNPAFTEEGRNRRFSNMRLGFENPDFQHFNFNYP